MIRTGIGFQPGISRRRWLTTAAASLALFLSDRAGFRSRAGCVDVDVEADSGPSAEERERVERIRRHASEAGLPELKLDEGTRYVALGTARRDFIDGALSLCEGLADDYLDHFSKKGFPVSSPGDRMTMVALDSQEQFGRFLGTDYQPQVTGIYEVGQNFLVLYDGRNGRIAGRNAERANTITLFHEATHQLTFNTGLLDRFAPDIPLVVSEGLGMYGEVRRPDGRTKVGAVNRERLAVISQEFRQGGSLLPLAELFDDASFQREETVQLAYSQAWLFVFGLMTNDKATERFLAYLDVLRGRGVDSNRRLEVAREHLGDLEELDEGLMAFASRLLRGR